MIALLHDNDRLGLAIERRLFNAGWQIERLPEGRSIRIALDERGFDHASVLILASDDDAGNVDLALTARRLRPDLPIVVRVFDDALAAYLQNTLDRLEILTMSASAASAFFEAAVRVIAERRVGAAPGIPARAKRPAPAAKRGGRDRTILLALSGIAAVIVAFTLFFRSVLQISYLDAGYFVMTTITTVGYGDIALRDASPGAKLAGMALMILGSASIAVLFGVFTDWVVNRRLAILAGHVRARGRGHVVIVGGGNLGVRVAQRLRAIGHRIVVVERDADNKNLGVLREEGDHVIIADAARDETLNLARVDRAAAVLCLTNSDAVNFQIALMVHGESADVPIILRVVSPELSAHVSEHGAAVAISPISIASQEFAAAAVRLAGL